MIGDRLFRQRYLREGREEGRKEGRTQVQELWEDWNRRREEAEAMGEPFAEPPPSGWEPSEP